MSLSNGAPRMVSNNEKIAQDVERITETLDIAKSENTKKDFTLPTAEEYERMFNPDRYAIFEKVYKQRAIDGYENTLKRHDIEKDLFLDECFTPFEWKNIVVPSVMAYSRLVGLTSEPYLINSLRDKLVESVRLSLTKYNSSNTIESIVAKVEAFKGELNEVDKLLLAGTNDALLNAIAERQNILNMFVETYDRLDKLMIARGELDRRIEALENYNKGN